jgi:hypothetical protein
MTQYVDLNKDVFFFEKTQEVLHFISLSRKKTTGVQPLEGGTHTHDRPHQATRTW